MSVIEHPESFYTKAYSSDNWIPEYEIVLGSKRKCCDNCEYFDTFAEFDLRDEDGMCLKNVANDEYGEYINDSDTFYCSYHKFKV